ncbi:MAG: DinB family protein [Chloroflexi bacterium]|nr:DinB family protein [Chloroflexota bacterium]
MPSDDLSFKGFFIDLMELSYERTLEAVEGLTDEQLWHQIAPGTNPVGWLLWHLSRIKDYQTSRVMEVDQTWISEGWAERFGLPHEAHGIGFTADEVAAFRADRSLLLGYADAAHQAALKRMRSGTETQFQQPTASPGPGQGVPGYTLLLGDAIDYAEHTGQMAYLHGVFTGPSWMKTMP